MGLDVTQHGEEAYVQRRRRDPDLARGGPRASSGPSRSRSRLRHSTGPASTTTAAAYYAAAIYGSIVATSLVAALWRGARLVAGR